MAQFKFIIQADRYPTEYNVEANSWHTACNRAVKEWKKSAGKGSRTQELNLKGFKIKL